MSKNREKLPKSQPTSRVAADRSPRPVTPSKPRHVLELVKLSNLELNQGDIVHVTHHVVPNGETTTSFLYIHLEPGSSGVLAQVKYSLGQDGSRNWKIYIKNHTFATSRIAYARVLGNNSTLNSGNIMDFMHNLERNVPAAQNSKDPNVDCHAWVVQAVRYLNSIKQINLPDSVINELRKEMIARGNFQATLARGCMQSYRHPTHGVIYRFPGYIPLVEKYRWKV